MPVAPARRGARARRTARSPPGALVLLAAAALWMAPLKDSFAMPKGQTPKVAPGHGARTNLKKNPLEVPLEQPEPEPEPVEVLPEYRPPFSFHLLTQFPDSKHMKEDTDSMKYIKSKLLHALEHTQDYIQHVEATLKYEEHFHRHLNKKHGAPKPPSTEDGQAVDHAGEFNLLAPYQVKVVVNLKNKKQVIFANPEKHAQATLHEAVDLAAESLKVMLQKQKELLIGKHRKDQEAAELDGVAQELQAEALSEQLMEKEDAIMEDLYQRVEAGKK